MKSVSASMLIFGLSVSAVIADEVPQKSPDSLLNLFTEGTIKGKFRTIYYNRDFDQETEDWATLGIGGHLNFETASLAGFSAGVGFKTGQGAELNSGDDGVYGGLLPMDSEGNAENYSALDEYFLRYNGFDTSITAGAQWVFTPAMRGHWIRLTEKKYRGVSLINKSIDKVELHGYYISDYMGWTDEEFKPISSGFTKNDSDDEGAFIGGVIWRAPGTLKLQAWDYYYNEVINQYYGRGQYTYAFSDDASLSVDLRYFGMNDTGDALAGDIETYSTGGIIGLAAYGFSLEGYFATNGDDNILAPFDGPMPILMQVSASDRAEEDAFGVKLEYDFATLGLTGLSTYVFYANFDTPDDGDNASTDIDEIDFNLTYAFQGWAKNASIRLRYAILDKDENVAEGEDINDFRVYLDFTF